MSISSRYKNLLRTPITADKLTLFQLLFEAKELTTHLALALLKTIHKELSAHRNSDRLLYKKYAIAIEVVRHHAPEIFQAVVAGWNSQQSAAPEEWFIHEKSPVPEADQEPE